MYFEIETNFQQLDSPQEYLENNKISRILFHNPYASDHMQKIYCWARELGFPFIIAERGALNNSILYDSTGFLADSSLFQNSNWNEILSQDEQQNIDQYILDTKKKPSMLETQGQRENPEELRSILGLTNVKQVVLICLQRPTDTATTYFNGSMGNYQEFENAIGHLANKIPPDSRILIKGHPLEDPTYFENCISVDHYHLYDLFEITDLLVVFNSGSGVQGLMWDMPIVTAGRSFYSHPGLALEIEHTDGLFEAVMNPPRSDRNARDQFLHYLVNKYYSFGRMHTKPTRMPDGSRMTSTTSIDFDVLRFDGINTGYKTSPPSHQVQESMLFDRYRSSLRKAFGSKNVSYNLLKSNPALFIFRVSRDIPIFEKIIDILDPIYTKFERILRSKKQSNSSR